MASWVEDIIQALKNLGGQATLSQIYEEVKWIRTEPLPETYKASIRERIEAHSSNSSNFKGKDYFRKVEKGVWALRGYSDVGSKQVGVADQSQVSDSSVPTVGKDKFMSTWIEDIAQSLKNLGGQATLTQIYEEVKRIRQSPLPKMWQHIIQDTIYQNSSDTQKFQGNDLFRKVDKGMWALRGQAVTTKVAAPVNKSSVPIPQNYSPTESFEEIANILRTIKQYRDYKHPDSSSWKEYVDEVFHILGFSTNAKNTRLMTLNVMGSNHTPKAIVAIVHPSENFDELISGISWESYLLFAASFYHINWGILTNGLQLKIIHYQDQGTKHPNYWPDFDGIVLHEKLDTFCTIYKVFSFIKGYGEKSVIPQGKQQKGLLGHKGEDLAERHVLRLEFWRQLLEKEKTKTKLHAKVSPGIENWISTGAGKSGLGFNYVVRMDNAQVELYIDRGEAGWNKRVFNTFLQHKKEIEDIFGGPLDWQLLPDKRASRIRFVISSYGLKDQEHWDELQNQLIESMIKLEKALRNHIKMLA